ncbi:MAG: hypothetical protein JXL84_09890 [Deltaproteobacteria bacterium]|nr:hypothetical protein [Deltaproteobacteria bacterium]
MDERQEKGAEHKRLMDYFAFLKKEALEGRRKADGETVKREIEHALERMS